MSVLSCNEQSTRKGCFWKSEGISGFHSLMALKDQVFDGEAELLADNYLSKKW